MTMIQRVAQVFGWVFVALGIWGFLVSGLSMEANPDTAPAILGIFPVNALHNLVHLALGIWGILAARSFSAARSYAIAAGAIYLVLAILGFIMPSGLGFVPLGGGDIWLHAILAVALLGFGLAAGQEPADRTVRTSRRVETDRSGYASGTTTRPGRTEPAVGGAVAGPRNDEPSERMDDEFRRDQSLTEDRSRTSSSRDVTRETGARDVDRDTGTRDVPRDPSSRDATTRDASVRDRLREAEDRAEQAGRDLRDNPSSRERGRQGPTPGSGGDPTR
ncbi:MAG TPA: DUF4383 domain-containing protein [Longimicrobiales bacterium]|nr:DUF4383 domain-containing protein [Longimicrobiales bacterium]